MLTTKETLYYIPIPTRLRNRKMTYIQPNTFAEACYESNTIEELNESLNREPDVSDMKQWNITEQEWIDSIKLAISVLMEEEM